MTVDHRASAPTRSTPAESFTPRACARPSCPASSRHGPEVHWRPTADTLRPTCQATDAQRRPCPRSRDRDGFCPTLARSEEHTSELQSLMRISYAVFCLKKKKTKEKIYHADHKKRKQQYKTLIQ